MGDRGTAWSRSSQSHHMAEKECLEQNLQGRIAQLGVSRMPLSLGVLNLEDMTPRLKNSNPINAEEECVRAHACVVIYAIFPPGVKFHSFH